MSKLKIENATIKYSRTRQVNQYEPETVEITADVYITDISIEDAIKELKFIVHKSMGLTKATSSGVVTVHEGAIIEEPTKKTTKKKASKKVTKKVEKKAEPVKEYTLEEVLGKMKELAKARGMSVAKDILKDFGVEKTKELPVDKYAEVVAEIEKCTK